MHVLTRTSESGSSVARVWWGVRSRIDVPTATAAASALFHAVILAVLWMVHPPVPDASGEDVVLESGFVRPQPVVEQRPALEELVQTPIVDDIVFPHTELPASIELISDPVDVSHRADVVLDQPELRVVRRLAMANPSRQPDRAVSDARVLSPQVRPGRFLPPEYPRKLRRRGIEGRVVLELQITPTGAVRDARVVVSSGYDEFDNAALEASYRWRFIVRESGGALLSVNAPVEFRLR